MAERFGLGVDFGGTKLLASVVNLKTGEILGSAKKKSKATDDPDALLKRIYEVGDAALEKANLGARQKIAGVGVGIAGQVDRERGILLDTPNLSQAGVELPLGQLVSDHFQVPAAIRNDVQIAALGEAAFGAGKGASDFLCVFVGTGIGGALVRRGKLVEGANGTAGEIGHMIVDAEGRLCGCGGRGHLEAYSSRTAITRSLLGDLKRRRPSMLSDLMTGEPEGALRSGILAKAVAAGDELVIETLTSAGRYLGLGLASAINLLDPTRIILGGGVIEALDLLFDVAVEHAKRESLPTPGARVEIIKAGLGDFSGAVGAAIIGGQAGERG